MLRARVYSAARDLTIRAARIALGDRCILAIPERDFMKTLKAAGVLALLALAFPAGALAHVGSATVSCTAADFHFSRFLAGANTIHYKVTAESLLVAHGDFALNQSGGTAGYLHVPLTMYGPHTVKAYAWWGPAGTVMEQTGGSEIMPMAVQPLSCAQAPPAPVPAPPTGNVAPVTPATPVAAPPSAAVAPAPAPSAPAGAVQGVTVSSPARIAHLGAQSVCSTHAVRVTVAGRQMRDIAFSINGRHVRTVTVRTGQRSVSASLPMRNRHASQVVTAHVRFRNSPKTRNLSARASRCAQVAVAPQFTG